MGIVNHHADEVRKTALGINNRDPIADGLDCADAPIQAIKLGVKSRLDEALLDVSDQIDAAYEGGVFAIDGTLKKGIGDIEASFEDGKRKLDAALDSGSAKLAATLHTGRDTLASAYEDGSGRLDAAIETGRSRMRSTIDKGEDAMNDTLHDGDKRLTRAKRKYIREVNTIPEPAHQRLIPINEKCDTRVSSMTLTKLSGKNDYYSLKFTRANGR